MPLHNRHGVAGLGALVLSVLLGSSLAAQQRPSRAPSPGAKSQPIEAFTVDTPEQRFRVVPINGIARPWALAFLPNGDILVTERGGQLRIVRDGVLDPRPISGIPPVHDTQYRGLNDIALHPRFAENQLLYFTYYKSRSDADDSATAVLMRARFDGGHTLADVRELLETDAWASQPSASRIVFGRDAKLYMSIGIPFRGNRAGGGAQAESAQDPRSHAGKILRLNDDGTAPADNPFVGRDGYRPEIFALGIRNALALIVHPDTGEIWENENGPQGGDEINIIRAGRNYGWPVISYGRAYTGETKGDVSGPTSDVPVAAGMEQPFLYWVPAIAVSGMTVYTGDRFPKWKGNVFVGGLRSTQLQRIILNGKGLPIRRDSMLTELKLRIREVRQGPDGLLYLLGSRLVNPLATGIDEDDETGALLTLEPLPKEGLGAAPKAP